MIHINPLTIDVAVVLGTVTLFTVMGQFIYRVTRFLDHISKMLTTWEGNDDIPGVLTRLNDIEKRLQDVQYHVKPNHGNSSVDAQNRQLKEIISYLKEKNNG